MTAVRTTLVSLVRINRMTGTDRMRDCKVEVETNLRGKTTLSILDAETSIEVSLDGAERIALIEALGGTVVR